MGRPSAEENLLEVKIDGEGGLPVTPSPEATATRPSSCLSRMKPFSEKASLVVLMGGLMTAVGALAGFDWSLYGKFTPSAMRDHAGKGAQWGAMFFGLCVTGAALAKGEAVLFKKLLDRRISFSLLVAKTAMFSAAGGAVNAVVGVPQNGVAVEGYVMRALYGVGMGLALNAVMAAVVIGIGAACKAVLGNQDNEYASLESPPRNAATPV